MPEASRIKERIGLNMAIIATEEIFGGPFSSTKVTETVDGFPRGDKAVDASFLASMMSCILTNGIVKERGEEFKVYPGGDLSVTVTPGCAWGNGYMAESEVDVYFELEGGHTYKVFIRFDGAGGKAQLMLSEDDHGMIPMRTASLCDLVLAEIELDSDAADISESDIEDTRSDRSLCGYVTSAVK